MKKAHATTLEDAQTAFETGAVLRSSREELEEMLVAVCAKTIPNPEERARAGQMAETLRQLLEARRLDERHRKPSRLAAVALVLALPAFLASAAQSYYAWSHISKSRTTSQTISLSDPLSLDGPGADARFKASLAELAKYAPTLRRGTVQAWWAGEQARQVQRLEKQARRQTLAGDLEGARQSISRADAIRGTIELLADYEKPPL